MGAVLSEEGCLSRVERPWDDRFEALKQAFEEAEMQAKRSREAERAREAQRTVLLGRQQMSWDGKDQIKQAKGHDSGSLLNAETSPLEKSLAS
mmetsp:Transcript_93365/g.247865  ORF Transcript_93365/g.247865 Transcript_93365/m.247865 type:complete len:93 (-) Transcript_93365:51-329(-)